MISIINCNETETNRTQSQFLSLRVPSIHIEDKHTQNRDDLKHRQIVDRVVFPHPKVEGGKTLPIWLNSTEHHFYKEKWVYKRIYVFN